MTAVAVVSLRETKGSSLQAIDDADLVPARLTVDLLRPVALTPVQIRSEIVRQGRRLVLVDAQVLQNGIVVSRASVLYLRAGEQPPDPVWTTEVAMPALPTAQQQAAAQGSRASWAYSSVDGVGGGAESGLAQWRQFGPKFTWNRDTTALVEGEPTSPFVRVALAGDATSPLTHFSAAGLQFINADYTLTLSRLPRGPFVGLAAMTHYSHAGVATGAATIFDEQGPIGSSVATALADTRFALPPQ